MVDLTAFLDLHFLLHYVHYIGLIMAIGAVMATDAVNSYLHLNPSIAEYDAMIAPLLSTMVWIGFLILAFTGSILFIQHPTIIHSTVFQLKMFFIGIIFLNGLFLNLWVTPKFKELAGNWRENDTREFEVIAGISAAVSVIGWLTVFSLGFLLANA